MPHLKSSSVRWPKAYSIATLLLSSHMVRPSMLIFSSSTVSDDIPLFISNQRCISYILESIAACSSTYSVFPFFFLSSFCTTGNSWGWNEDGTGCIGCGRQEEFYGCADVQIVAPGVPLPRTILDEQDDASSSSSSSSQNSNNSGGPGASSVETRAGSSGSATGNEGNSASNENSGSFTGSEGHSGSSTGNVGNSASSTGNEGNSASSTGNEGNSASSTGNEGNSASSTGNEGNSASSSGTGDNLVCYGVRTAREDRWCQLNCQMNYCPASHCRCVTQPYPHLNPQPTGCRARGGYAELPGYHEWCRNNCPRYCPGSICVC